MTELLTAAQMRAIEQAAIASGKVTGLELMERAGRGVVEAIFDEWPEMAKTSHRAMVLCGPGNNGGDGFVVARLLKEWGWEVEVFALGRMDRLPPDAADNHRRWVDSNGSCHPISTLNPTKDEPACSFGRPDLVVDAVFGTGLTRPRPTPVSGAFSIFQACPRIVAVDLSSGLCSDSGRFLSDSIEDTSLPAHLTVTFHSRKTGHLLAEGPELSGKIHVHDIGLGKSLYYEDAVSTPVIETHWLQKLNNSHKYTHGHALILSGPPGHGGAARLAARGALRIGAGLVTLACPPDAIPENAARLDAIMLRPCPDAEALGDILADKRITALCLGPGMGVTEASKALIATALAADRPTVLDADALTLIAANPDLFALLHDACILTPHAGEFARLFADIAEKLAEPATKGPAYSKVDATREAAARAGCTVLCKGPDTVIAAPDGRAAINSAHYDRAAPWLATAGSGDVLAGFITGLLARGFGPMQAAESAAWLHVECARSFGPGLIAEDLPEELPKVLRALGL